MSKKGAGHIEIILAFILFVGFLIFGLYFFNPLNSKRVLDSSLSYASEELAKNITTAVALYSVIVDNTVSATSIEIPLSRGNIVGSGVRVTSPEGHVYRSSVDRDQLIIDRELRGNRMLIVTFGDFASLSSVISSPAKLTLPKNYTISSSQIKEVVGEKEATALKSYYESDYSQLKRFFNIPGRVDFGFSIDFNDGTNIRADQTLPPNVEVFSHEESQEVLRTDGNIVFANRITRVW